MTRDELIAGLATLNAPNQGMNYHAGGFVRGAPRYDQYTGERLSPPIRNAELTVYGERARFLYRLIDGADALLAALKPTTPAEADAVGTKAEGRSAPLQSPNTPEGREQQQDNAQ